MTAQSYGRELSGLGDIVAELQRDGWIVEAPPLSSHLPEPLRGLKVDLIARRGDETLVGEVASRHSAKTEKIDLLARRVKLIPNARFEVYWRGDSPDETPPLRDINALIKEVRAVSEVSTNAALLLAWSTVEGAIMRLATGKIDLSDWRSPRQLLTNLYSLGDISESDFERLSAISRMRNEIAHGLGRATPTKEDISFLLDVAERMATGRYVSADQEADSMVEWFLENYEDPAEQLPYDSAEGGYQYFGNGPYDAEDVLRDKFPDASEEAITEAVRTLESTGVEWVSKRDD